MRVIAMAALGFIPASSAEAQEIIPSSRGVSRTWSKLDDAALLEALRAGGHIIVFRHFATDGSQEDRRDPDLTKRGNQRNLPALGQEDAQALGAAFRKLGIPHATAGSSGMFRTKESAELAFGAVEPTKELMGRDGASLKQQLTQVPPAGKDAVFFTHQLTLMGAVPEVKLNEVEEGNCIIIKPGPTPERLAHLAVRDWERLAGMPSREQPKDLGDATAMQQAATAILTSFDGAQRATLTRPFDAARTRWERLIATFTHRLAPTAAESALARIKAGGMEKVSPATIGGETNDAPTYCRVQGPTFVIEFLHCLKDTTHVYTVSVNGRTITTTRSSGPDGKEKITVITQERSGKPKVETFTPAEYEQKYRPEKKAPPAAKPAAAAPAAAAEKNNSQRATE